MDNPKTLHNLARVLYRLGRTDEAADHLKQCTEQSDLIDPRLSLATIMPGCGQSGQQEIFDMRKTAPFLEFTIRDIQKMVETWLFSL